MILDSNIIIYSILDEYAHLKDFFRAHATTLMASEISYVEVLGYHMITEDDKKSLSKAFASLALLPITRDILDQAVTLRQARSIKLGDSIIAATALCHGLPLATRNTGDFDWIDGLTLKNPVDNP